MERVFTRTQRVPLSRCDDRGLLSLPGLFTWCMDLAAAHAEEIGLGMDDTLGRGLFWLTVRTRIRIWRRPASTEIVTASTWPERAGAARCNRDYTFTSGGELLAAGKTEWAVLEVAAGRLHPMRDVYSPELTALLTDETVWTEPFERIGEDFSGCGVWGEHTVSSSDIDLGGHMNNAAYARMLFGTFTCAQLRERDYTQAELCYRAPSYEGERLTVRLREGEDADDAGVFGPDGRTVLLARMKRGTPAQSR